MSSKGKSNPLEIHPVTREAMQSEDDIKSTYLDMSCSTTIGHLPQSVL
jgi:hypothetical protein